MMACTHAAIGAVVGSMSESEGAAFAAGFVSHGVADLVPHKDYGMEIEVPLLGLMLGYIAIRYGLRSRQFAGAVGGFSPDIENGLFLLGVLPVQTYPTHTKKFWFIGHGRKVKSILSQILLISACLCIVEQTKSK